MLYLEILDQKRQGLLSNLSFLKDLNFYLAGGTALALQIKHRLSIDFDFYSPKKFDSFKLYEKIQGAVNKPILLQTAEETLITRLDNIEVSFFGYHYPLVKPLVKTKYLALASLEDIAAMKAVAIVQRGTKRDFVDLYFLTKTLGIKKILKSLQKKYPNYNLYLTSQALVYFEDAEKDPMPEMLVPCLWEEVKEFFKKEVKRVFEIM